jgi:membrane protease YdiL (CAAX protease family)
MLDVDSMPLYLKVVQAGMTVLVVSCFIFAMIQWSKRRSRTGFRFGEAVGHPPLLGYEVLTLFGILLLLLSGVQIAGAVLVENGTVSTDEDNVIFSFVTSSIFYLAYLLSVHFFLKKRDNSVFTVFHLDLTSFKNGWLVALIGLGAALIPVGLSGAFAQWAFEKLGYSTELQDLMKLFLSIENPFLRLAIGLIAVIGAPIVEETLFRGILYPTLKKRLGFGLALFLTSALFAAIHYHALTALPLTILAVCLTLVYEWRGNLASCILMHAFFNLLSLTDSILFGKYEDLSTLPLQYFP